MGDAIALLKVMMPFFELVDMPDHMHQFFASYAALSAANNDELEVVMGTRIKEVPAKYLTAKKELLKNGDINHPKQIHSSLQAFQEKWRCLEKLRAVKAAKGKSVATKGVGNSYA